MKQGEYEIVRVTWNNDNRRGSALSIWREEVKATARFAGEAREVCGQFAKPGDGFLRFVRWAPREMAALVEQELATPARKG